MAGWSAVQSPARVRWIMTSLYHTVLWLCRTRQMTGVSECDMWAWRWAQVKKYALMVELQLNDVYKCRNYDINMQTWTLYVLGFVICRLHIFILKQTLIMTSFQRYWVHTCGPANDILHNILASTTTNNSMLSLEFMLVTLYWVSDFVSLLQVK